MTTKAVETAEVAEAVVKAEVKKVVKVDPDLILLFKGGFIAYKCKSGNEYVATTPNEKVYAATKEDFEELTTNPFISKMFIKTN